MDKQLDQLEQHLRSLLAEHEQLLSLIRSKADALRAADASRVGHCCELENHRVQKIGEIEKQRQAVVIAITQQLDPTATQQMSLTAIAEHTEEPRRGRLLVLQAQLTQHMNDVRRESAVLRTAMQRLMNHVNGMIQSVVQNVTGSGTYDRRGVVASAPAVARSFSATA